MKKISILTNAANSFEKYFLNWWWVMSMAKKNGKFTKKNQN